VIDGAETKPQLLTRPDSLGPDVDGMRTDKPFVVVDTLDDTIRRHGDLMLR
jgi:hypothetical protein